MHHMAVPSRTCVGCRGRRPQSELLRFVLGADGRLRPDMGRRRKGRSAYVCPDRHCLERAVRSRAFDRSFRRSLEASSVEALVAAAIEELGHRLAVARSGGPDGARTRRLGSLMEKMERSMALLDDSQGSGGA